MGINKKDEDNGVQVLVSYEERAWGMEVGLVLKGVLTDSKVGRIGRERLEPRLRNGYYYMGLFVAVAQIAEEVGYGVEEFEPMFEEPGVLDVLLSDP